MRYKAEVWIDNIIAYENQFSNYSNPKQVVRKVVNQLKGKFNHYIIYVCNEVGSVWIYSVKKIDKKYHVKVLNADNIYSAEMLEYIFTNNQTIRGLIVK